MNQMLMLGEWRKFSAAVLPANCPDVQRVEMRRAFYAGAQAILFRVITSFAPESEPTEADLKLMDDVHRELLDFAKDVEAGRK
jgi:hypothetical protein